MGVWESNGIEKNFDELVEEIQKVKQWTLNEINALKELTNLKKIQQFKKLQLESISVDLRTENKHGEEEKYIIMFISDDCYNLIKDKINISANSVWSGMCLTVHIRKSNEDRLKELGNIINLIYELDKPTHEENLKIRDDNLKIQRVIFDIFDRVGIKTKYYGYKTSRSTKKTEMYYNFPSEISNQIPTYYSENSLDEYRKNLLDKINRYWEQEIAKIREKHLKKEQEQKEKEKNRKLALLLAKYNLSLDCDWHNVLEVILDKNKYLRLAHYLEKNRNDWSNGYDYAETGLESFGVKNELDHKIYNCIRECIDDWCGDGRVFRDCEYNYNVLYGIAEEQDANLVSDYYEVMKYVDEH